MAHTKSSGAAKNARDSGPKYLGVKKFDGEHVSAGAVLIRQRGTKFLPGANVARGADDTLYALRSGVVKFSTKRKTKFNGDIRKMSVVNITEL